MSYQCPICSMPGFTTVSLGMHIDGCVGLGGGGGQSRSGKKGSKLSLKGRVNTATATATTTSDDFLDNVKENVPSLATGSGGKQRDGPKEKMAPPGVEVIDVDAITTDDEDDYVVPLQSGTNKLRIVSMQDSAHTVGSVPLLSKQALPSLTPVIGESFSSAAAHVAVIRDAVDCQGSHAMQIESDGRGIKVGDTALFPDILKSEKRSSTLDVLSSCPWRHSRHSMIELDQVFTEGDYAITEGEYFIKEDERNAGVEYMEELLDHKDSRGGGMGGGGEGSKRKREREMEDTNKKKKGVSPPPASLLTFAPLVNPSTSTTASRSDIVIPRPVINCPICAYDLTHLNLFDRETHTDECLTALNEGFGDEY